MLCDSFERTIRYARLSVTEACNIRCHYCMLPEGSLFCNQKDLLEFDEVVRLVGILAQLGVSRVRLTGGEPLLRRGITELIWKIKQVPKIEEVLLTTNGILLAPLASSLKEAGLEKINIHLDTLKPERFEMITRQARLNDVLDGIHKAQENFSTVKINAVLQRGINDDEIEDLLLFCSANNLFLRLIEMMPIGPGRALIPHYFISCQEVLDRLAKKYTLIPSQKTFGSGPARYYEVKELKTSLGLISPISQPFCQTCNRIRISANGRLQDCLAYDGIPSLKELLRDPRLDDAAIANVIKQLLLGKPESHEGFIQSQETRTPCMNGIGG